MPSSSEHWNEIFKTTVDPELGWWEPDAAQTLELLADLPGWGHATVFLPGAGTSVLVDQLVRERHRLVVNDISGEALARLRARTGEHPGQVTWLCGDISRPLGSTIPPVDVWIDRAVLHFLLEEQDILGYLDNLRGSLRRGGHALFAEFSPSGAPQCAGLTLHRYSVEDLGARLGPEFALVRQSDYTFINPYGEPRPYVYALYERRAQG